MDLTEIRVVTPSGVEQQNSHAAAPGAPAVGNTAVSSASVAAPDRAHSLPPPHWPKPRVRREGSFSNPNPADRGRPVGLPHAISSSMLPTSKKTERATMVRQEEIEMTSGQAATAATMLANLRSTGDLHVSLPTQPLTLTLAAARVLRPSKKTRTDTSGLTATASGLLGSVSGTLSVDADASVHSTKLQPPQVAAAAGDEPGKQERGPTPTLSRKPTDENERAMTKIVEELKEEMARIGHESRGRRVSAGVAWAWIAMAAWVAGFVLAAVLLRRDDRQVELLHLYLWRWCVVLACLPVVWVLPQQLMFVIVLILETQPSSGEGKSQLVYYLMGIRSHAVALLRMLLSLVVIHYAVAGGMDEQYRQWEGIILKIWICASLFFFANVLKSIIARALSRHFHTKSYFERMRDAVQKEYFLLALTKPRRPTRYEYDSSLFAHRSNRGLSRLTAGFAHLWSHQDADPAEHSGGGRSASIDPSVHGRPGVAASPAPLLHHCRSKTMPSIPLGGEGYGGRAGSGGLVVEARATTDARGAMSSSPEAPAQGGNQRARPAPDDEAAPLLTGGGPSSSNLVGGSQRGGGAASRFAAATAAAATPFSSRACRPLGDGAAALTALQRWRRSAAEALASLRSSWRHAVLLFRHDVEGDVTTVVGRHGLTAMSPKEAAAAAGAQADVQEGRGVEGMSLWDQCRPASVGAYGGTLPSDKPAAGAARRGRTRDREPHDSKKQQKKMEMRTSLYWLEQHIRRNKLRYTTLTDKLGAAAEGPDVGNEVSNKREAKRLAFYVYWNVLGLSLDRPFVVPRDLEAFFDSADEVKACFKILDTNDDGRATLDNIVDAIVAIYKERKKLAITLKDTKSVVSKLELVCGAVIHLGFVLLYFWIFEINISNAWVSISTILLSFAFVFGTSVKTLYESVLFLFVVHAFDVGDWLQLSNADMVKVEEIALLSITCVRSDGRRMYIPTAKLMQETTVNLSRSDTFWDSFSFLVDLGTPASVLETLEQSLQRFVSQQPREFTGCVGVIARTLDNPTKLKLVAYWEFNHCADDSDRTGQWRSKLLLVACSALQAAGVQYSAPPEAPWPLPAGTLFWDPCSAGSGPGSGETVADGQVYLHSRSGAVFARGYGSAVRDGSGGGTVGVGEIRFRGKALAK